MTLKERIQADFIAAFKAGEKKTKDTLGMVKSKITEMEKSAGQVLEDTHVLDVLKKYDKQLDQSIAAMAGSVQAMEAQDEKKVIAKYMPAQISMDMMRAEIENMMTSIDLSNKGKAVGSIMNHFKQQYNGQYNPGDLKKVIDEALQ